MSSSQRRFPFGFLLSIIPLILFWIALAPTQLGGQVTYVIVDGNSMEPTFRLGDLVLVRERPAYQVGDAVTYMNAEMGQYVFHRIVEVQSSNFILQGDHNTWLDSYHPSQPEIIGKLWIHIPGIGKTIQWVRQPLPLALGCGLLGGLMLTSLFLGPPQRGRGKNKPARGMSGLLEGGLYLTGFTALVFLVASVAAFTRPLTRPAAQAQYQQAGSFFYTAEGAPGVYDAGTIRTGDPIFPRMTCLMKVGLTYTIAGNGLQEVTGVHQLFARVMDEQSGWQRTFALEADTPFNGSSFVSLADLDLCQIEALVAAVEQQTGLHAPAYTLEVISHSAFMGKMAGQSVIDSFDASLVFKFDKTHFYLATDSPRGASLQTTKTGTLNGIDEELNTFSILGQELTVQAVRVLALLGLAFSLSALLAFSWYYFSVNRPSPETIIRLKYGNLLMDAQGLSLQRNLPFVDVASIDDLARLAERQNTMITHMAINFLHYYMVQSDGVMYRYVSQASRQTPVLIAPIAPENYLPDRASDTYEAEPVVADGYRIRVDTGSRDEPPQTIFISRMGQ